MSLFEVAELAAVFVGAHLWMRADGETGLLGPALATLVVADVLLRPVHVLGGEWAGLAAACSFLAATSCYAFARSEWLRGRRLERARVLLGEDEFGALWRDTGAAGGEPLCWLEVTDATPQPDGSRRRYALRVPPHVRTPREAVAWTFGFERAEEYAPVKET
ncbi:MAG TPA: hypothetical protein VNJ46_04860 [Gaiellaceae bacterium]|nr:hypothetical protein [Gaiellaceae bacterium]